MKTLLLLLAAAVTACADPGHEVRIGELTQRITEFPDQPDLYYQRAVNLREVPRLDEARADFEKALALSPGWLPAERELAQMDATAGKLPEGIARLEKAIAAAPAGAEVHLPACYAALAGLLLNAEKNYTALEAAKKGIARSTTVEVDLFLYRAEAQRRLGLHDERVRDLAAAKEQLKSYVLMAMWIDALIDAGQTAEALPVIEKELANMRLKSTWLIRRGRALLRAGRKAEAEADLAQALAELDTRIRPESPDLSLVCDRALIHALTGRKDEARRELDEAKTKGASEWMMRNAETALAQ